MKYRYFIPALLVITIVTACGGSSSEETTTPENTSSTPATPVNAAPTTLPQTTPAQTTAVPPAGTVPVAAPAVQPVTTPSVAAGLNPEHGKPGHRCDIAVGAPLNSAPATAPATVNATPKVVTTPANNQAVTVQKNPIVVNPAATTVAAGMNPEHGKPGHRCDIAVGAPLNSPPNAAQPKVATNPQPVVKQTPATLTTPPVVNSGTTTAAGMNPEHGKPGHRCDIAVGAPLNSKPAQ